MSKTPSTTPTITAEQQSKIWTNKLASLAVEIETIVSTGRVLERDPSKLNLFRGMYKTLEGFYSKFVRTVDDLATLHMINDNLPDFPDAVVKVTIDSVRNRYFEIHGIYAGIEHSHTQSTGPNDTVVLDQASLAAISARSQSQLPKLDIPTFSGQKFSEWPLFRDTFQSMVHTDANLSNIAKFHYLVRALKEPALSTVKSIPLEGQHYELAWQSVLQQYDNKRQLAASFVSKILTTKIPPTVKSTLQCLQFFLTNVAEHIQALKTMKIPNATEYLLFELAVRYLDPSTREAFELKHSKTEFPQFDTLLKFVKDRYQALALIPDQRSPDQSSNTKPSTPHSKNDKRSNSFFAQQGSDQPKPKEETPHKEKKSAKSPKSNLQCFICSAAHTIPVCPRFTSADSLGRLQLLKTFKGCFNCLHPHHATEKCQSKHSCRICRTRHFTDLHEALAVQPQSKSSSAPTSPNPTSESSSLSLAVMSHSNSEILLGTAQARIRDKNGVHHNFRLVVDSGSQLSFATKSLLDRLGLAIEPFAKPIVGVGQSNLAPAEGRAHLSIAPTTTFHPRLHVSAVVVKQITAFLPQNPLPATLWQKYAAYELADPSFWIPGPVDMLLGADVFMDILLSAPIRPYPNQPSLLNTIFGHIIIGRHEGESNCQQPLVSCFATSSELSSIMHKFWEVEEVPKTETFASKEDSVCEEHFQKTHTRLPSGRYEVALPFKTEPPPTFGYSKRQALKRLYNLEHKLYRNPHLHAEYHNFLNEYLQLDHMEPATQPGEYFIPHHGVFKTGACSKIRVVFDASARTSCKNHSTLSSLNENLYVGPNLQNNICLVLLNFRRHPVVFSADCVKMYRQISVRPSDRKYQHILWRFSQEAPVQEYELKTVTYGMGCSSFLSHRVIRQLVEDEGSAYPQGSRALLEDSYVDDITTGAATVEEAIFLRDQLIELLAKGGFTLGKWCSNDKRVLETLSDTSANPVCFQLDENLKILGSQWMPLEDTLSYNTTSFELCLTKRSILSAIARTYDPLGYLAPVIFQAKVIFQETWNCNLDWDEPVIPEIAESWSKFYSELPQISEIRIPRYLQTANAAQVDVVGFCDASERGYCACIYLRARHGEKYQVFLIQAKTKLAPRKTIITIPRLELCGAYLLTQLYASLAPFLKNFTVSNHYFFSDSNIVLAWLKTSPALLKVFIAHRVSFVNGITQSQWWHHVRSEHNPADCGSRGIFPSKLASHHLWWYGPPWLVNPEDKWPTNPIPQPIGQLPELKAQAVALLTIKHDFFIIWTERYSSYKTLVDVFAYMLRLKKNSIAKKEDRLLGPITAPEFSHANVRCIKLLQQHYFSNESDRKIRDLFANLNVFEDADGLLRVGGRLMLSGLPYPHRHPLLLPKNAHFTLLLVRWYHKTNLHAGSQSLHAAILQKYWIPGAKLLIRKVKTKCKTCLAFSKRHLNPYMGNLPASRFATERAFFHVGVDFAGPLLCKESTRRNAPSRKSYVCIFICFATKAIHLEVVPTLSTEGFLDALDRFIARRGIPAQIFSDCGSNFIGAARYLKEVEGWFKAPETQSAIIKHCAPQSIQWNWKGVKWHFNPPHSPHFGGLWESGVKSFKTQLYKTVGNQPFTERELATIITKIEGILNSRPLFPASSDPNDPTPLTPAHLLIGGPINAIPEHDLTHLPQNRLSRWQFLRQRTQAFWNSWKRDYLNTLQQRRKWTEKVPNLNVGDLVLVKKADSSPFQWPMARVKKVHPGADDIVRVVTVETASGTYQRSMPEVIPLTPLLELDSSSSNP